MSSFPISRRSRCSSVEHTQTRVRIVPSARSRQLAQAQSTPIPDRSSRSAALTIARVSISIQQTLSLPLPLKYITPNTSNFNQLAFQLPPNSFILQLIVLLFFHPQIPPTSLVRVDSLLPAQGLSDLSQELLTTSFTPLPSDAIFFSTPTLCLQQNPPGFLCSPRFLPFILAQSWSFYLSSISSAPPCPKENNP